MPTGTDCRLPTSDLRHRRWRQHGLLRRLLSIRPKDEPIISAAIAAKATHLLTGDKQDFGPFFGLTIQGVKVVTPAMLAKEILG